MSKDIYEREMYPCTCFLCKKETSIPFKPDGKRPVYCRDCFQKVKLSKQSKPKNEDYSLETYF